jgi:hypothetical protein
MVPLHVSPFDLLLHRDVKFTTFYFTSVVGMILRFYNGFFSINPKDLFVWAGCGCLCYCAWKADVQEKLLFWVSVFVKLAGYLAVSWGVVENTRESWDPILLLIYVEITYRFNKNICVSIKNIWECSSSHNKIQSTTSHVSETLHERMRCRLEGGVNRRFKNSYEFGL